MLKASCFNDLIAKAANNEEVFKEVLKSDDHDVIVWNCLKFGRENVWIVSDHF